MPATGLSMPDLLASGHNTQSRTPLSPLALLYRPVLLVLLVVFLKALPTKVFLFQLLILPRKAAIQVARSGLVPRLSLPHCIPFSLGIDTAGL